MTWEVMICHVLFLMIVLIDMMSYIRILIDQKEFELQFRDVPGPTLPGVASSFAIANLPWVSGINCRDMIHMILCYPWHNHQQHGANFFFYLVKAWGHLWVMFRAGWGEFWEGSGMCPKETPSLPGPIMPVKWQWSIQVLASQFPGLLLNKPSDPT